MQVLLFAIDAKHQVGIEHVWVERRFIKTLRRPRCQEDQQSPQPRVVRFCQAVLVQRFECLVFFVSTLAAGADAQHVAGFVPEKVRFDVHRSLLGLRHDHQARQRLLARRITNIVHGDQFSV